VRAATAYLSRQWVCAIPNQDVDPSKVAQYERFAPTVPGDRDSNIPDS
jgi:hypothetical protein